MRASQNIFYMLLPSLWSGGSCKFLIDHRSEPMFTCNVCKHSLFGVEKNNKIMDNFGLLYIVNISLIYFVFLFLIWVVWLFMMPGIYNKYGSAMHADHIWHLFYRHQRSAIPGVNKNIVVLDLNFNRYLRIYVRNEFSGYFSPLLTRWRFNDYFSMYMS